MQPHLPIRRSLRMRLQDVCEGDGELHSTSTRPTLLLKRRMGTSDAIQVLTSRGEPGAEVQAMARVPSVWLRRTPLPPITAMAPKSLTDDVGSPVGATDANGDSLTYTLGGSDARLTSRFELLSVTTTPIMRAMPSSK